MMLRSEGFRHKFPPSTNLLSNSPSLRETCKRSSCTPHLRRK
ncbi:hypothetical protein RSAG8_03012, partial [Rhizoctonia solani AG-8 WAC10335]